MLRRGDVFVDFTANIGFFTFLAASLVKKEGKVIAFEPNPQNIQLIYSTFLVSPGLNIKIYPYAVSDSPGIAKLRPSPPATVLSIGTPPKQMKVGEMICSFKGWRQTAC